ncbi:hypothetical protein CF642_38910 [Burkholderia pseudomallei]|nr:hypothetical protein CF642_38910 [Burkholderia pseudomallei]
MSFDFSISSCVKAELIASHDMHVISIHVSIRAVIDTLPSSVMYSYITTSAIDDVGRVFARDSAFSYGRNSGPYTALSVPDPAVFRLMVWARLRDARGPPPTRYTTATSTPSTATAMTA